MRRRLVLALVLVVALVGAGFLSLNAISQPEGKTFTEMYGPKQTYVVRGNITKKTIRDKGSVTDAEVSENSRERAQNERHKRDDRWLAFLDVDVREWVEGRGTHKDEPKKITLLRGVAFTDKGDAAGSALSGDWTDRTLYDELTTGSEYEFHIVTEGFHGKYYGLMFAYPVVSGVVQDKDFQGFRMRDYRFEEFQGGG